MQNWCRIWYKSFRFWSFCLKCWCKKNCNLEDVLAYVELDLFHDPEIRNVKPVWIYSHNSSVCFQPSSPLNAFGLLAEVIYYLIRGNGALCLLRSSFFPPFTIYHSPNDGSLHPALPHMSFCRGMCVCVCVF